MEFIFQLIEGFYIFPRKKKEFSNIFSFLTIHIKNIYNFNSTSN